MKKYLIAIAMMLTLGQGQTAMAQGQTPKEEQELVDSTKKDALEAYSDTTDIVDSTVVSRHHRIGGYSHGDSSIVSDIFGNIGIDGMMGMTFVLMIVLIIFVIAPVLILALLFFFIYKNRKQKMRLAQMAMQNGQPIPDELLNSVKETDKDTYQSGMRQLFLGMGLMVFLGYTAGHIGFGIGVLVFFIGLGKVVIAKTNKNNSNNFINNSEQWKRN